jgi:hypothetical protein
MRFVGEFQCSKCGKAFTIDLGPQFMGEKKTPKKIAAAIAAIGQMLSQSCLEHETECGGKEGE